MLYIYTILNLFIDWLVPFLNDQQDWLLNSHLPWALGGSRSRLNRPLDVEPFKRCIDNGHIKSGWKAIFGVTSWCKLYQAETIKPQHSPDMISALISSSCYCTLFNKNQNSVHWCYWDTQGQEGEQLSNFLNATL